MRLSFPQAVEYIIKTKGNAFAFVPEVRRGKQVGGEIFFLTYCVDYDSDPKDHFQYVLHYASGRFRSSEAEAEIYSPDEIPEQAKQAIYQPTTTDPVVLDLETQLALQELAKGIIQ